MKNIVLLWLILTMMSAAGIVDDILGANFVQGTKSGDPYDDNGHGTFVTGVVGAVGNNGIGISGVAQVASIICELLPYVLWLAIPFPPICSVDQWQVYTRLCS